MQSLVISSPLHRTEIAPSSAKVFNADVITIQSIHIILRKVRYHGMDFFIMNNYIESFSTPVSKSYSLKC
jgi:hypothetical protein